MGGNKRKAESNSGGRDKRSKRRYKKRPTTPTGTSRKSEIVAVFARGLSNQIPEDSISHLATNESAIRLLLEKSTESLPMGSAIRKAVSENFSLCIDAFVKEMSLRLKEVAPSESTSEVPRIRRDNEKAASEFFLVFNQSQFDAAMDHKQSLSVREAAKIGRKLRCTNFATADVYLPEDEKPRPKIVLDAFRSALLSGQINAITLAGYLSKFFEALEHTDLDGRTIAPLIRDLFGCLAINGFAGSNVLSANSGVAGLVYGKILGILLWIAIDSNLEQYSKKISTIHVDDSSSDTSDSYSDREDEGTSSDQQHLGRVRALQDVTCTLSTLFFGMKLLPNDISATVTAAYIVRGVVDSLQAKGKHASKKQRKELMQTGSLVLVDSLLCASMARKSDLPGKVVTDELQRLRMIERWINDTICKAGLIVRATPTETQASVTSSQDEVLAVAGDDKESEHETADNLFVLDTAGEEDENERIDEVAIYDKKKKRNSGRLPKAPASKASTTNGKISSGPAMRPHARGTSIASSQTAKNGSPAPTRRSARTRSRSESLSSLLDKGGIQTRRSGRVNSRDD